MTDFARYPSLVDRVVLITGGGSGIGAAMVEAFAGNDAKAAFVDIQAEPSQKLGEPIGAAGKRRPLFIPGDLTDIEALRGAIGRVRHELGPVGVLVNNAANDDRHPLDTVTPEYWDKAFAVN